MLRMFHSSFFITWTDYIWSMDGHYYQFHYWRQTGSEQFEDAWTPCFQSWNICRAN